MADDNNDAKETLFASDLLVHIGSQEIESVLPTASEYTRSLYDQVGLSESLSNAPLDTR